jgi:flagellar basal-body rod protein FlgF
MDKGIYTALSGGIAKSHELELVANNLANANTPGFKEDVGTFNEYLMELRRPDSAEGTAREIKALTMQDGRPPGDKSFVEMDAVYTNFRQGSLQNTSRSLDMGLEGKGFFEVLTPSGIRYTRQGNFNVSADGRLVTVNGYSVLARLQNPPDDHKVTLDADGKVAQTTTKGNDDVQTRVFQLRPGPVEVTPSGLVTQNNQVVGTLSIVDFKQPQWLEKVGTSYYRNDHPENIADTTETTVHQGFLETSNVNPVKEMTKLIEVTRAYESHMQAIKTYQEIDGRTANDIAKDR